MTVKCLSASEKQAIQVRFEVSGQSIAALSYEYRRSRRTIIRVLEEAGIDPGIRRRVKPQAEPDQLPMLLVPAVAAPIPTKTPWYQPIKDWFKRLRFTPQIRTFPQAR